VVQVFPLVRQRGRQHTSPSGALPLQGQLKEDPVFRPDYLKVRLAGNLPEECLEELQGTIADSWPEFKLFFFQKEVDGQKGAKHKLIRGVAGSTRGKGKGKGKATRTQAQAGNTTRTQNTTQRGVRRGKRSGAGARQVQRRLQVEISSSEESPQRDDGTSCATLVEEPTEEDTVAASHAGAVDVTTQDEVGGSATELEPPDRDTVAPSPPGAVDVTTQDEVGDNATEVEPFSRVTVAPSPPWRWTSPWKMMSVAAPQRWSPPAKTRWLRVLQ